MPASAAFLSDVIQAGAKLRAADVLHNEKIDCEEKKVIHSENEWLSRQAQSLKKSTSKEQHPDNALFANHASKPRARLRERASLVSRRFSLAPLIKASPSVAKDERKSRRCSTKGLNMIYTITGGLRKHRKILFMLQSRTS